MKLDLLHDLKDELDKMKEAVERRVETSICRKAVEWNLSRLLTLDPERAEIYRQALALLDQKL